MAKLLLNLRNVPDDEADDVRSMLDANGIAWHETPPGPFALTAGGIHVSDDAEFLRARKLMDAYQAGRRDRARAEHAAALRDGTARTFRDVLREEPLKVVVNVVAILFLLALVALPVLLLRGF